MAKLKNTTQNKLILIGSLALGGALFGYAVTKKGEANRKQFIMLGSLIGLFLYQGISSWVIEKDIENE